MLPSGLLSLGLHLGVIRLLPKVSTVPLVSQFNPLTMLAVDYNLYTKMFVAPLLNVLPSVLRPTQLCSVRDRLI
jgi:hypothetical protein